MKPLTLLFLRQIKYFSIQKLNMSCKVAVCQFTATNNKSSNLEIVKRIIDKAVLEKSEIIFLPEGCDFIGTSFDESRELSEPLSGPIFTEYKAIAKDKNVWLSVGGFHEKCTKTNQIYNSHILINNKGEICSIYRKVHLFNVSLPEKNIHLRESDLTTAGTEIVPPVLTPFGNIALSICYDVRFPEQSLLHRRLGATILTFPSAFTNVTGQAHWEVLLRARAIETQCFVIAAAQYGKHSEKRTSYGNAMIVDPWGKILSQCPKYDESSPTNQSFGIATLDTSILNKIREEMPVLSHRRNDLYNLFLLDNKLPIDEATDFNFSNKPILGSTVFYRTEFSFAFTNIRCVVPGHVLISSIRVARRLEDLSKEEVTDLFQVAVKVQKVMEQVHSTNSTTVCIQDGVLAGQTVPHVHIHILPRSKGDFDKNDDIYDCLARHDKEGNESPLRDISEMIAEARQLKKYLYE